jgi:hypothetical protein
MLLLKDAIALEREVFRTMERKLPKQAAKIAALVPLQGAAATGVLGIASPLGSPIPLNTAHPSIAPLISV